MKVQSSENKLVITEEFIFDLNKLPLDPNNHFKKKKNRIMFIVADYVSIRTYAVNSHAHHSCVGLLRNHVYLPCFSTIYEFESIH